MEKERRTKDVWCAENSGERLSDLPLRQEISKALAKLGIERPSPIQQQALPLGLSGTSLLLCAKSGTGKTLVFTLVALNLIDTSFTATEERNPAQRFNNRKKALLQAARHVQAVAILPTREIALQVADEVQRAGWYITPDVRCACCLGGIPHSTELSRLRSEKPHFLVATPGRFEAVWRLGFRLAVGQDERPRSLKLFVLDEADRLLDSQFRDRTLAIIKQCVTRDVQFIATSATYTPSLVELTEEVLEDIDLEDPPHGSSAAAAAHGQEEQAPRVLQKIQLCSSFRIHDTSAAATINLPEISVLRGNSFFQFLLEDVEPQYSKDEPAGEAGPVPNAPKAKQPSAYLMRSYHIRLAGLFEILSTVPYRQSVIFCNHFACGELLTKDLREAGIATSFSSGRLSQGARTASLREIKSLASRVLVCTDVMARGVDLQFLDLVVNYDIPPDRESFLHRSGRAGRFGKSGVCVFLAHKTDMMQIQYYAMQLGMSIDSFSEFDPNDVDLSPVEVSIGGAVETGGVGNSLAKYSDHSSASMDVEDNKSDSGEQQRLIDKRVDMPICGTAVAAHRFSVKSADLVIDPAVKTGIYDVAEGCTARLQLREYAEGHPFLDLLRFKKEREGLLGI